jgi:hypothetical protein
MITRKAATALLPVILVLAAIQASAQERLVIRTANDRDSYNRGVEFVKKLKQQDGVVNLDMVMQGMQDELAGKALTISDEGVNALSTATPAEPAGAAGRTKPARVEKNSGSGEAHLAGMKKTVDGSTIDVLVMQRSQDSRKPATVQPPAQAGSSAMTMYMYRDYAAQHRVREMQEIRARALRSAAGNE